ncbi:hypothetical protein M3649_07825 [Ureibacillus chungkukjangi]|uniref:hypothetical protein n=1 Tax=Ureibacillus chungkukjangi TaxID=1202712 RepID=UPI00204114CD|nr:hypothetical protein [Ureibacillus chungkukjangi]MCM3388044.1 hypothetical protein [Ureibacillus chungkukjangi]
MSGIFELEYRGLNLLDEISSVEIAIDSLQKVIHIYDINQVVEPEFNFSTKQYQMCEGFYKMVKVLADKNFFQSENHKQAHWIDEVTWIFYGSRNSILKIVKDTIIEIPKEGLSSEKYNLVHGLYPKYVLRVL